MTHKPTSTLLMLTAAVALVVTGAGCDRKGEGLRLFPFIGKAPAEPEKESHGDGSKGGGSSGGGSSGGSSGGGGTVETVIAGCNAGAQASRNVAAPTLLRTLPGSWEEGWLASPTLVDLDRDGRKEIVAPRHGTLYAWKHDGTLLWRAGFGQHASNSGSSSQRMWASAAAADVTGDGFPELVVASDLRTTTGGNVAVYDRHGQLLPGWPARFGNTEIRSVTAADVTGEGHASVIVNKLHDGPSTAVLAPNGQLQPGWPQVTASCNANGGPPCLDYGGYNQNVGAGDLDGDGVADVVTTYDLMAFGIFRGDGRPFPAADEFSDSAVSGIEMYHDVTFARRGWGVGDRSEFTESPPVLVDLDGDGKREVALLGNHEHSESTQTRGFTLWVVRPDGTRPQGWEWPKDLGAPLRTEANEPGHNIILQLPSLTAADLHPSEGKELLFPSSDGFLHLFSARGESLWRFAIGAGWPFVGISEPVVADLNGDGSPEILFTTYTSGAPGAPEAKPHLHVLAADGHPLHQVPLSGRGAMAAPSVADLDGDGTLELVVSLKDAVGNGQSGVQVWSLPGSNAKCLPWPTGRGNAARTGTAG